MAVDEKGKVKNHLWSAVKDARNISTAMLLVRLHDACTHATTLSVQSHDSSIANPTKSSRIVVCWNFDLSDGKSCAGPVNISPDAARYAALRVRACGNSSIKGISMIWFKEQIRISSIVT